MFVLNNMKAFFHAALPWVTAGVGIAVLAVRSAAGKKKEELSAGDYGAEGMCLGMSLGVCFGTLFDSVGIGISLGMLAGLAIGSGIRKTRGGNEK